MRPHSALFGIALFAAAQAFADVAPPPALVMDGVPPIADEVAKKIEPYSDFRPHGMMSWHPQRREVLIRRRLNATNQVHVVTEPGAAPAPLTDYPDAVSTASFPPTKGEFFIFSRGEGGNETFRLYRQDPATPTLTPLTPEPQR